MSRWTSLGRRRALVRRLGPPFGALTGLTMTAVTGWALWVAYDTHEIFLPLANRIRMIPHAHEPGFFWTSVVFYLVAFTCCLLGAISHCGDMISAWRLARKGSDIASHHENEGG